MAGRQPHPQGRHQRGHPRLGDQRRGHLLPPRLGGRPAPLPDDGARLPVGHRQGGRAADAWRPTGRLPDYIVACVGGGSNAIGIFHPFVADERRQADRGGGRRAGPGHRPARRHPGRGQRRRAARHQVLPAAGRATGRSGRPTASPPGWTTRAWGRSTATARTAAAPSYVAVTDDEALEGFQLLCRDARASSRRWSPAHAVAYAARMAADAATGDQLIVVNLSGRGDKDMDTVAAALGVKL